MNEIGMFFVVAIVAAVTLYLFAFWRAPRFAVPGAAPLCFGLIWVGYETDRTFLELERLEAKRHHPFAELVSLGVPSEMVLILAAVALALFALRVRSRRFQVKPYPWIEAAMIGVSVLACGAVAFLRLEIEAAAVSLGVASKVIFERTEAALEVAFGADVIVYTGLLLCAPLVLFGSVWAQGRHDRR